jgi:hypothetical protein
MSSGKKTLNMADDPVAGPPGIPEGRNFKFSNIRVAWQARQGIIAVRSAALAIPTGLQSSSPRLRGTSYLGSMSNEIPQP